MKKWGMLVLLLLVLLGTFPTMSLAAQVKTFDQDLVTYLKETSKVRGSEVTKEDIEYALYSFDETLSLDDFNTIEELKDFLGEPIAADLHNLKDVYADFDLNEESLRALLKENGLTIDDFIYEEDLYYAVYLYTEGSIETPDEFSEDDYQEQSVEELEDFLDVLQDELGLTLEELDRIDAHFTSIEGELSDPATLERLDDIGRKLSSFEEFDTTADLSPSQLAELLSIYNEISSIFHIKSSFTIVQGKSEKPLSFVDLMNLEELKGASLKVTLSTTEGRFLADLIITGDMVDSDVLVNTGEELQQSAEGAKEVVEENLAEKPSEKEVSNSTVEKTTPVATEKVEKIVEKKNDVSPPTEKTQPSKNKKQKTTAQGEKLPETATNYLLVIMLGVAVAMLGFLFYQSIKKA
ncbi:processed acidic surface protein [Priestia megaterium]|uniref:processed acidic surface protein n=1 Tax=Priestia megaterium TaxID=1404 RepID=UPI0031011550